jgi:hypothetical protein
MDHNSIRQQTERCANLVIQSWGRESLMDHHYRGKRVLEEAAELFQALGGTEAEALRIVLHVFSRKVGEPQQELAGTAFTLLATAHALGYDLGDSLRIELDRVETVPMDILQAKHESKARAGI